MNVKRIFSSVALTAKRHAPEIFMATGIVTGAVATVMACKKTVAVNAIVEEAKETLNKIEENRPKDGVVKKYVVNHETNETADYTEEVAKQDKIITVRDTTLKVAKEYTIPAVLYIASVICILSGFNIIKKRSIALGIAYSGLAESYKLYRERVKDAYGVDIDKELFHGITKTTKETEKVNENGEREIVESEELKADKDFSDDSDYCVIFSRETAPLTWQNSYAANKTFIRATLKHAQYILDTKGYIFLNDVYEALGMPRTATGAVVGWMIDDDGDNFIDADLQPYNYEDVWKDEPNFILNFNCQGLIYDKFEKYERQNFINKSRRFSK